MPQAPNQSVSASLRQVIDALGVYPPEAFEFVSQGLSLTVERVHAATPEGESHHVTGRQLCLGLRDLALERWGLMATAVLRRWNITSTMDFGRIVFAMVDSGLLSKTPSDSIDDFRNVFDLSASLEEGYRIKSEL